MPIVANYICDWCKISIQVDIRPEGPRREKLPDEPPLTPFLVPNRTPSPQWEWLCDVCMKAKDEAIIETRRLRKI
jgi:hypothetical protein